MSRLKTLSDLSQVEQRERLQQSCLAASVCAIDYRHGTKYEPPTIGETSIVLDSQSEVRSCQRRLLAVQLTGGMSSLRVSEP